MSRHALLVLIALFPSLGEARAEPFATLYRSADFKGQAVTVDADIPNLRTLSFNNLANSIRVTRDQPLALYRDQEFKGVCLTVRGDIGNLGRTPLGRDHLTSVRVAWTCEAGAYEVDACILHPCGPDTVCRDLARPAPNSAEGRTCECAPGMVGSPATGCRPPVDAGPKPMPEPKPEPGPLLSPVAGSPHALGDDHKVVHLALVFDAEAARLMGQPKEELIAMTQTASDLLATLGPTRVELQLGAVIDWRRGLPTGIALTPEGAPGLHDVGPALEGLNAFFGQRASELAQLAGGPVDALIVVTGRELGHRPDQKGLLPTIGKSYIDSVCTPTAVGVMGLSSGQSTAARRLARLVAFMVGARQLPDTSIMGSGLEDRFAASTQELVQRFFASKYGATSRCLDERPARPICGDGVVDGDEECDPGLGISDTCCVASTCRFAPGCQCANTDPCCVGGRFTARGVVCRASAGECDVADTCDGFSATCGDVVKPHGRTCGDDGACYDGACVSGTAQVRLALPQSPTAVHCPATLPLEHRCTRLGYRTIASCDAALQMTPRDGTPCGDGLRCLASRCVAADALKRFSWAAGAWSACGGGQQTRTVGCVDESRAPASDAMCTGPRPAVTRSCTSIGPAGQ